MTSYSVQPRGWIFVKSHGFLYFTKNKSKNIGKNISKNVSSKHSQNLLDHAKQWGIHVLKTATKKQFKKEQK